MTREELNGALDPVRQIFGSGEARGMAYFFVPALGQGLAMGNVLAEADLALAVYRIIEASGFDVQRICGVVSRAASEQESRN